MSFRKLLPVISNSIRAYSSDITDLKGIVAQKIVEEQKKVKTFRQTHGLEKVGDVNVNMLYGGMRGLLALVTETSILDPEMGIRFRGLTIPDIEKKLPKAPEGESPLPEGLFWLLLTSDVPNEAQVDWVSKQWAERATIPEHALTMLHNFPTTMHPMSQLSATVIALNQDSKFAKAYKKGIDKATYWEYFYEDSMDLLARLPTVAAIIYRNNYKGRTPVSPIDQTKDWSYNMANMMGYDDPKFIELIRLYLTIHCDHEGGNVTAHAAHLVGSSLSDPYLAYAAGLNGLAGPLHGLANQEVLEWLKRVQEKIGGNVTDHQLKEFIQDTLKEGKVIPGFGHAVLRKTDPRYTCQREFALKHMPNDPLFKLVSQVYKIVPQILQDTGKVQNPWPNVDAHSGCLLHHYNLKETQFYTVMFGVSRAIGVLSSLIWDRALGLPIERPKSITTNRLMELVQRKTKEVPKPLAETVVVK